MSATLYPSFRSLSPLAVEKLTTNSHIGVALTPLELFCFQSQSGASSIRRMKIEFCFENVLLGFLIANIFNMAAFYFEDRFAKDLTAF
jgi:hypothetical protein